MHTHIYAQFYKGQSTYVNGSNFAKFKSAESEFNHSTNQSSIHQGLYIALSIFTFQNVLLYNIIVYICMVEGISQ